MMKKFRSFLSIVLAVGLEISCIALPATVSASTAPSQKNGVYQLATTDDLQWAAQNPGNSYILTKDIDISAQSAWTPIGSESTPFSGVFNGAGHKVTVGINDTQSSGGPYFEGLFGYVSGTVVNLTVDGTLTANIASGYVGGIAANLGGGQLLECTSNVNINAQGAGVLDVGGLAGAARSGVGASTIRNCVNNGAIHVQTTNTANGSGDLGNGTNGAVGGMLGLVCIGQTANVTACVNNGAITMDGGKDNIGGMVGQTSTNNNASTANITYCANKGTITGKNIAGERAAGMIAYLKAGVLDYDYNLADVIEYSDNGTTVARQGYGNYFGIFGYANLSSTNMLECKYCYNASPDPLEAEICTLRNPQYATFQNFYMGGREEYETTLNTAATAGTAGTTFTSASDLLTKITATSDGAKAYTANPTAGGYPVLYYEKGQSIGSGDYNGVITTEKVGTLRNFYYVFQLGGSVSATGLTVSATLSNGSTTVETDALASTASVKVLDATYVPANGSTLYTVAMNSIPDTGWTTATITAQKNGATVFTKTIQNSGEVSTPVTIPFGSLPQYPNGTISSTVYNAGPGMAIDQNSTTSEDSKMAVISNTDAVTFAAYVQTLISGGFTQIANTQIDSNVFYKFKKDSQLYYLYYTASAQQVRVIQDNGSKNLPTDIDSGHALGTGKTQMYVYSIDYTHGEGQCSLNDYWCINCGAMIIYKLADNSLFIIDSGHQRQSSNAAMEGLLNFLYQITGQEKGTKLDIRAWFFSHAHGDHVYLAHSFVDKYHDDLNVESIMFNIPSFQTVGGGYDSGTFLMKASFNQYFPNAKYVKLHTGEEFSIQGLQFEVLHTHEDAVTADGKTKISDFNDTSTVFKLTMDGKSMMMLGDASGVDQADMLAMYSGATLKSDIVQVAHHGFNDLTSLYAKIQAPVAFWCNSYQNAGPGSGNDAKYNGVLNATSNVKALFADPNTWEITVDNGAVTTTSIPSYRAAFNTVATLPALAVSRITSSTQGTQANLNAVLAKPSLSDQFYDKSITGTTASDVNKVSSLALDGSTTTKYVTSGIPAAIAWTMKEPVAITSYVMYTADDVATNKGQNPQKWVLCGSNDGTTWTTVDGEAAANLPNTNQTGVAFNVRNPGKYLYYCIRFFSTVSASTLEIGDIGLYTDSTDPAQTVIAEINALPSVNNVTLSDEASVTAALDAYNALTDAQKAEVTNYATLQSLVAKIAALKDQAAAKTVIDAITALPATASLTLGDESAVAAARSKYDALTDAQKTLVSNYSTLTADEAKIAELKASSSEPSSSSTPSSSTPASSSNGSSSTVGASSSGTEVSSASSAGTASSSGTNTSSTTNPYTGAGSGVLPVFALLACGLGAAVFQIKRRK